MPVTNQPRKIACLDFQISSDAPGGVCFPVEYHDGLKGGGTDPVNNEIVLSTGPEITQTFDCMICVQQGDIPKFYCGGPTLGPDGFPALIEDVNPGQRAELCFWYVSPVDELTDMDELQGLTMAMSYDCNLRCIASTFNIPPDSITAQVGADFIQFHCDNDPFDGDLCEMVLGIVVDVFPPIVGNTLPGTNVPLKLACVEMEVSTTTQPGECLAIRFTDGVNGAETIPVKNLVSVESNSFSPETFDCKICPPFTGPKFLCGGPELGPDGKPELMEGRSGEEVELCLWYCSPGLQLQGFVMALTYDCRVTCLEDCFHIPEDSILAELNPGFVGFQCDNDPDDGDGCEMIFSVLVEGAPPFVGRTLPPTDDPLKLACVKMLLPPSAECGDCFDVNFENNINGKGNKVPVKNIVSIDNFPFAARTNDCIICVSSETTPVFKRGDCNFDDLINISDPAEVISFLFGVGTWKPLPPCLDACDANDDGRLDLGDSFFILSYLFNLGTPPPSPGPDILGIDETEDKIECDLNPCP